MLINFKESELYLSNWRGVNIVEKIFETERLYVRKMDENDLEDLKEIHQDPIVMEAYEHAFSDEEVEAWLEKTMERYKKDGFALWAVIDKATGEFLGEAGLTLQLVEGKECLEIGYLFKRKHWHKGYAIEVAKKCKEYAFENLLADQVCSIIKYNNYASQKVAEKNGLRVQKYITKKYMGKEMEHLIYVAENPNFILK